MYPHRTSIVFLSSALLRLLQLAFLRLKLFSLQISLGIKGDPLMRFTCDGSIHCRGRVSVGKDVSIVVQKGGRLVFDGNNYISDRCLISVPSNCCIKLSRNVSLQTDSQLLGSVHIGKHCVLGPSLYINSGSHSFASKELPICLQDELTPFDANNEPVYLSDDCWIGQNVTILKGSTLPAGTVVGAKSLLTSSCDFPPYSVVVGVPARPISRRS
jgi:acetyltransferase-like isoleucine patch superfamily enzyme